MKLSKLNLLIIGIVFFTFSGPAMAADGARVVQYSETDIVPIYAKVRYSTLIVLPANEEILDYTTGDKDFWIINGVHNLCYVHPAKKDIQSDLNLVTASGHIYSFLLTEISDHTNDQPDLKVFVEWKKGQHLVEGDAAGDGHVEYARASVVQAYEAEAKAARTLAAQAIRQAREREKDVINHFREQYAGQLHFDYAYKSKAKRPPFSVSAIYHDDKFTYIKSHAQEKPTIYAVNDGKPRLINFDYENGVYIVPQIIDRGYLALGKQRMSFERQQKQAE